MTDELEPKDIYGDEDKKKTVDQRKEAERLRKRHISDVRKVLGTVEGRRIYWDLLKETGVFRNSFSANANQTAFNEGRRDVGLAILADVNKADSDAYPRMQREYWSERQKNQEAE